MEKTLQFDQYWFIEGYKHECLPINIPSSDTTSINFSRSPSNITRINSQGIVIPTSNLRTNFGPQNENSMQGNVFDDSLNNNLAAYMGTYSDDDVNLRRTENIADILNSSNENDSEDMDLNSISNSSNLVGLTEQPESSASLTKEYVDSELNANISESESENEFEVSFIERELALTNPMEAVKLIPNFRVEVTQPPLQNQTHPSQQ